MNRIQLEPAAASDPPPAWWQLLLMLLLMPLWSVVLFGSVVTLCFGQFVLLAVDKDYRFARRMRRAGRFTRWRDLKARLSAGEGTIIIEMVDHLRSRVWWTPDDVLGLAPVAPQAELTSLSFYYPQPFDIWCFGCYLAAEGGTAILTRRPFRAMFVSDFWARTIPNLPVVCTVFGGPLEWRH